MSHAIAVRTSTAIRHAEIFCQAAERVVAADKRGNVTRFEKAKGVNVGYGNVIQSVADIELVRNGRTFHIALQANADKTFSLVYDHMNPVEAVQEIGVVYDMLVQAEAAAQLDYAATSFARDEQGEWSCQLEKI